MENKWCQALPFSKACKLLMRYWYWPIPKARVWNTSYFCVSWWKTFKSRFSVCRLSLHYLSCVFILIIHFDWAVMTDLTMWWRHWIKKQKRVRPECEGKHCSGCLLTESGLGCCGCEDIINSTNTPIETQLLIIIKLRSISLLMCFLNWGCPALNTKTLWTETMQSSIVSTEGYFYKSVLINTERCGRLWSIWFQLLKPSVCVSCVTSWRTRDEINQCCSFTVSMTSS